MDSLLEDLPESLGLDVGLLRPVLAAEHLLARRDVDASADSTEDALPRGSVMDRLLLQAAAAARRGGNLALTARLLLQQCRDAAAPDSASDAPLGMANRVEHAELVWAESPLPAGRLEAAKLLLDSLRLTDAAASEAETISGQLKARAWLLLQSWLSELHGAQHDQDDPLVMLPTDNVIAAHGVNGRLDRLAVLDHLQLSSAQRDMAVCLRSAVAADEHSAEAWRALGLWLGGITAAAVGVENPTDVAVIGGGDGVRGQARGAALFAFCQSLRAAGRSQVPSLTVTRVCCVSCFYWCIMTFVSFASQSSTKQA